MVSNVCQINHHVLRRPLLLSSLFFMENKMNAFRKMMVGVTKWQMVVLGFGMLAVALCHVAFYLFDHNSKYAKDYLIRAAVSLIGGICLLFWARIRAKPPI